MQNCDLRSISWLFKRSNSSRNKVGVTILNRILFVLVLTLYKIAIQLNRFSKNRPISPASTRAVQLLPQTVELWNSLHVAVKHSMSESGGNRAHSTSNRHTHTHTHFIVISGSWRFPTLCFLCFYYMEDFLASSLWTVC